MKSIWFLDNVNLFSLLCPHKLEEFKQQHEFNNFKKKDYIYFEADSSNKVYLIEKGKVKIGYYDENGTEVVKAILSRGELFGEKAILGEEKRNEFAQSLDSSTSICPVGVDTMHKLMRDNKSFSLKIYKFIGLRFKRLERRLQLILFKDTKTRLLEFFNELYEEFGYENQYSKNKIIEHPYTQKDIATLIGTSRSNLNVLMKELKEENKIDFSRNRVTILQENEPKKA